MRMVTAASGRTLNITVDRDGKPLDFAVMPDVKEVPSDLGVTLKLGDIGIMRVLPARVGTVVGGSPAEQAGIQHGDTIDHEGESQFSTPS